jgi:acyl carrier protein
MATETENINKVVTRLKEIIKEHLPDVDADIITETTTFDKDLNLGSLEMSTILMDIEDSFQVRITDEEIEQMKNVGDLVRTVVKHLATGG